MALAITQHTQGRPAADALVFAVFSGEHVERHPYIRQLSTANRRYLRTFVRRGFINTKDEVDYVVFPSGTPPLAFLVGLGKRAEWSRRRFSLFCRRLVSIAASQKVTSLAVHVPSLAVPGESESRCARRAAENVLLAAYRFGKYQKPKEKERKLKRIVLTVGVPIHAALREGKVVAEYVNLCRDLANTPASHMTPRALAVAAKTMAKGTGVLVRVLGRAELEKENMHAMLGVARGSAEEPTFITMEYRGGPKRQAPLVFVGKGVTFDSGGINLKPSQALTDMHMDMSGGAAVLTATAAIAARKLPVNVVALVPAVENMPGGSGYKPGDVLTSRSGVTIEVVDTDAEGRVILADALDFAKQYKPQLIVDVATLTGAAMVGLGLRTAALFTPDHRLAEQLEQLGEESGDYVWHMPMDEEYEPEVQGTIGDIANVGKVRYGGAIHGALFLKRFVGKHAWAHIDIAPTMASTEGQFLAKGATGTCVRILIALAEARASQKAKVSGRAGSGFAGKSKK